MQSPTDRPPHWFTSRLTFCNEEGGQLTEAVRRKPYSVILLEPEIEEIYPQRFNTFLQIDDEAKA